MIREIKVNFMRHLASLRVVSWCPPLLFDAALSSLAISVAPYKTLALSRNWSRPRPLCL